MTCHAGPHFLFQQLIPELRGEIVLRACASASVMLLLSSKAFYNGDIHIGLNPQTHLAKYSGRRLSEVVAADGQQNLLAWLDDQHFPISPRVIRFAARTGDLRFTEWTFDHITPYDLDVEVMEAAAASGSLELVQWLSDRGCRYDEDFIAAAANQGHTAIVEWALSQPNVPTLRVHLVDAAVQGGYIDITKILYAHNCPISINSTLTAAANGRLHMLQWLHEAAGVRLHPKIAARAATCGRLDILEWSYKRGAELPALALSMAARCGHKNIVEWLVAHGCELTREAVVGAANSGYHDLALYMQSIILSIQDGSAS